jgi:hypothetical protein
MVVDFVHERWAAKRPIAPDMWRCVGRHADSRGLADLKHVLTSGAPVEREAAALALSQSPDHAAKDILKDVPDLVERISNGSLTWATIDAMNSQ